MLAITLENLYFSYEHQVVFKNLSLGFEVGKIHGLLGPNGAGKSTLIRLMSGLLKPALGSVKVLGMEATSSEEIFGKSVGLLSDHAPLYFPMTVLEYLIFCASIKKVPSSMSVVSNILERLDLTEVQNQVIKTLSTGFRQRVALAQALVHNPAILILDEPTSGLDPQSAGKFRSLIKELSQDHTILFSSHHLHDVEQLCSSVTFVNQGKILFHGEFNKLLEISQVKSVENFQVDFKERDDSSWRILLKKYANLPIKVKEPVDSGKNVSLSIEVRDDQELSQLLKDLIEAGVNIQEVKAIKNDLEKTFLLLLSSTSQERK